MDGCSAPTEYLLVSEARDVRSIPWSVIIIGAGLIGALRSTTLPLGCIWPCPTTIDEPVRFEILHRDIFSIDIDPRLYEDGLFDVLILTFWGEGLGDC